MKCKKCLKKMKLNKVYFDGGFSGDQKYWFRFICEDCLLVKDVEGSQDN